MFGTTDGQILVMSAAGLMLTQVATMDGVEIMNMAWSCEKFCLSEQDAESLQERDSEERE